jgi:hypothetical protein
MLYDNQQPILVAELLRTYQITITQKTEVVKSCLDRITNCTTLGKENLSSSSLLKIKKKTEEDFRELEDITKKKNIVSGWLKIQQGLSDIIKDHSDRPKDINAPDLERNIFKTIFFDQINKETKIFDTPVECCIKCNNFRDLYLDRGILNKSACGKIIEERKYSHCNCNLNSDAYPLCSECIFSELYDCIINILEKKVSEKGKPESLECVIVCPVCSGYLCPFSFKFITIRQPNYEGNLTIGPETLAHDELMNIASASPRINGDNYAEFLSKLLNGEGATDDDKEVGKLMSMDHTINSNINCNTSINQFGSFQNAFNLLGNELDISKEEIPLYLSQDDRNLMSIPPNQLTVTNTTIQTDYSDQYTQFYRYGNTQISQRDKVGLESAIDSLTQKVDYLIAAMQKMDEIKNIEKPEKRMSIAKAKRLARIERPCLLCKKFGITVYGHYGKSHNNERSKHYWPDGKPPSFDK